MGPGMSAWLAWVRLEDDWGQHEVQVALWCDGPEAFEPALRAALARHGARLIGFAPPQPGTAPAGLGPETPLLFGPRRSVALGAAALPQGSSLRRSFLPDVVPLGAQIGLWPKRTHPESLSAALFGPLPGMQSADPAPLRCYALLDAARAPRIPDLLAAAELPYRCLFLGEDGLQAVAPHLVEITADSDVTRSLFTTGGLHGGIWDSNAAIFLRSRRDLDGLFHHLRRLYRISPAKPGTPNTFLRYWAPETLRDLTPHLLRSEPQARALFSDAIEALLWRQPDSARFVLLTETRPQAARPGLTLDAALSARFNRAAIARRSLALLTEAETLIARHDPAILPRLQALPRARRLCHALRIDRLGIRTPRTAAALLCVIALTNLNILAEPAFAYATRNPFLSPEAKARQLLLAYRMISQMEAQA